MHGHGAHHQGHHHGQGCGCEGKHMEHGCGCGEGRHGVEGHFHRRYQTKEEQSAELENYLGALKLEVQAVEERLADLRA